MGSLFSGVYNLSAVTRTSYCGSLTQGLTLQTLVVLSRGKCCPEQLYAGASASRTLTCATALTGALHMLKALATAVSVESPASGSGLRKFAVITLLWLTIKLGLLRCSSVKDYRRKVYLARTPSIGEWRTHTSSNSFCEAITQIEYFVLASLTTGMS